MILCWKDSMHEKLTLFCRVKMKNVGRMPWVWHGVQSINEGWKYYHLQGTQSYEKSLIFVRHRFCMKKIWEIEIFDWKFYD